MKPESIQSGFSRQRSRPDFFRGRDKSSHSLAGHSANSFRRSPTEEREPQVPDSPLPKKKTILQTMSSRLQIKFLMEKTREEANWDMDNDSDVRGGSEDDMDDDDELLKNHYSDKRLWKAIDSLFTGVESLPSQIAGIGGTWGFGYDQSDFL